MQSSNAPSKLVLPFASAGGKNTIPVASQIGIVAGKASLADGFPPLTRTPLSAGGVPPSGLDMNGILYEMSAVIRWANAGGGYAYDSTFATDTNVGGYPKGARVMRSDGLGYWFNTVENNITDPEAAGTAAADGWVPDFTTGASPVTMTNANVTLTELQYGKPIIIITGALTANLNLIFPKIVGEWLVINRATGAYSITCKTAAGTGIAIPTGYIRGIYGDGVNIDASENAADLIRVDLAANSGASLIGFKQPDTNAIATTLQNRGRLIVFATDFGAIGDNGTTDNYTPFANALAYLATLPAGGVLKVTGGALNKYVFKKQGSSYPTLFIPSNVTIEADADVYYIIDASTLANSGVHTYGTALFTNVGWNTTGAMNIAVVGGNFKSANATSGATGNGGFIAFKNVLRPKVKNVKLLDIFGACRLQLSFCYGARIDIDAIDYEVPHLAPWSFEDGVRIGSGCIDTEINAAYINSGDDCIAINNEASECQDTFTSPIDSRIPASSLTGANIKGVRVNVGFCSNQNGNAVRIYVGPSMTSGAISVVRILIARAATKSPSSGGTVISALDSGSAGGNAISDVQINGGTFDCSQLTPSGTPGAIQIGVALSDFVINDVLLNNNTTTYGITCGVRTKINNTTIIGALSDGIYVSTANCELAGNQISGTTGAGIKIDNGAIHTRLIGNRIPTSTGPAILEIAGASYTYAAGNDVQGATACSIANNTGSVYVNNPSYNPIGGASSFAPGASPYTYTTATSPETVTVGGGTVSNITIGGVSMGLVAGAFSLPPHTAITVTYSVVPTMTKIVH